MYPLKSDAITRDYFNSILVTTRNIDSDLPSTKMELWGKTFATPVMTAALSHLNNTCENGMVEFAKGAKDAGAVHFVGMGEKKEFEDIAATGACAVKIVKPHEDDAVIFDKLTHAYRSGAFAVGMDIDHAVAGNGEYDNVYGLPMHTKTLGQLREYVRATPLPFVVKGVLSVEDAVKSVEAGAAGIIVSHHHGMIDSMVPPLMVLPQIAEAVKGQIKIFVDCCFESGLDAFKALALGADAVCVGRYLMGPLKEGKAQGVTDTINRINGELKAVLARTGSPDSSSIDPAVLRFRNF